MAGRTERVRETRVSVPTADELSERQAGGWRIAAVEWERDATGHGGRWTEEVPFGLKISSDGRVLEENPSETQVLIAILEYIVQERRLTETAAELNRRGFTKRDGMPWDPSAVFNLLPRLVEAGPRIFRADEWVSRRTALLNAL